MIGTSLGQYRIDRELGSGGHAAKAGLDDLLAKVPAEYHATMLGNRRENRELVAGCKAAGIA